MKWTFTNGMSVVGSLIGGLLATTTGSLYIADQMGITPSSIGQPVMLCLLLGSPFFAVLELLALRTTSLSELTGTARLAAYLLNSLGALVALWFLTITFFFWRIGPINSR